MTSPRKEKRSDHWDSLADELLGEPAAKAREPEPEVSPPKHEQRRVEEPSREITPAPPGATRQRPPARRGGRGRSEGPRPRPERARPPQAAAPPSEEPIETETELDAESEEGELKISGIPSWEEVIASLSPGPEAPYGREHDRGHGRRGGRSRGSRGGENSRRPGPG